MGTLAGFGMVFGMAVPGYAIAAGAVTLGMGLLADEVRRLRKQVGPGAAGRPVELRVRVAGARRRRRKRRTA